MLPSLPPDFRGAFRTDADARAAYSESAGIMRVMPLAVAVPERVEDLQLLCAWAAAHGVALVPRGSGSSMSGAAVGPGVIVDTWRFREIAPVDEAYGRVHVGAAVTRSRADAAARAVGMRFPIDPSSGAFATIGGMAGTNASGARTMRFGSIRRWVRSIDCVFADGSTATVSRDRVPRGDGTLEQWRREGPALRERARQLPRREVRKDSSGYAVHDFADSGSLVDLLVGSEGTLAFFTGVTLDLTRLPGATASLLSSWRRLEDAMHGADLAREAGAVACELLDASFLRVASRGRVLPVPNEAECALIVEMEDRDVASASARAKALDDAWRRAGASTTMLGLDPESEEALWSLRHAASPILSRLDPHVRSMQVIEDGCVPPHRLADYVRGVRQALETVGVEGVLFGHAGDAHLHVNALVDVREERWKDRVRTLFDRVVQLTESLGGTMAGEHGDGRLRSGALPRFWGADAMALFGDIKRVFDPAGILNPGVKIAPTGDAFAHVKYDPSEPLQSATARRVLDEVEAARGYDASRLEMLDRMG